jgi:type II secretory pathway pseudopilin PulG
MRKEWPAETAAAKRAREKLDAERACLEALKQRMREKPNEPTAKKTLYQEFSAVSDRALDRCYARAARETGAVAWSKAGRRRRQPSDSN